MPVRLETEAEENCLTAYLSGEIEAFGKPSTAAPRHRSRKSFFSISGR